MDEETNKYDERMKRFLHYWDMKNATEEMIETAPGELQIIIDALADYYDIIQTKMKEVGLYHALLWQVRAERIKKIQEKLETAIGYDRDKQLEKCKKKKRKEDDVGADALELAFKRSAEKKNEVPKEPTEEELKPRETQMSLFDMMNKEKK